jgi:hypothetical protein
MKILLNAFDSASRTGPFPNLAIMKLAAFHKQQGDEVALVGAGLKRQDVMLDPDIVYISCIFDWNGPQAHGLRWMYGNAKIIMGGSGLDLTTVLPPEVEACEPDLDIYDNRGVPGWPYALGFSSRGCNRKCPFCVVPIKEGRINSTVLMETLVRDHDQLILLDNNIMQDPAVNEKLRWLANWGGKVNFSQGIDARILERRPQLADLLFATNFRSRTFKSRVVTLAYDFPQLKKIIGHACEALTTAGFDLKHEVQFFVLCNFNTTWEQDLQRVLHLRSIGANAYVMIYDKKRAPLRLRKFQRWTNNKYFFWATEWKDYNLNPDRSRGGNSEVLIRGLD